ncbi:carbohydrate ABC transporter membrane protein 1, CUT1 family [Streptomyces zhaozhouensis]|uniref:Carbohydrate ABC transporter membrane protein 1, CUT1 family n=1 Tax=Streptomyces zhaozhouensis TaxID=1300267 RepID=A0A286DIL5_9ACTN|nr:sugar ABC transporter permease [Streptomyces zhaozhouensis]SOD58575.1 carbohydrate ABC transporter membrane protein 1, CUT1 family [Streptomyces zhaozhouensis]
MSLSPQASRAAPKRRPGPPPSRRRTAETRAGYAFLAPWLLGFIALTAGPMIASLYLAFTDYHPIRGGSWIGLDNFDRLLDDPRFLDSVEVTATYAVVGTPIKLAAALGVAMLLNSRRRGQGTYRSLFYAPSLIGASVSVAIVWKAMFNDQGIVDDIGQFFGMSAGGWVGNPDLTLPMMILLAVWQFGAPMVIFLAGLKQIPHELYEAAQVDGAGPARRFFRITLPMLSPVLFFNLVLETINSFQIFASAFIISGGQGGPANSTLFYTLYLYQRGFGQGQLGYAAAMAWLLVIVVGIITLVFFRTSRYWVHYSGDGR